MKTFIQNSQFPCQVLFAFDEVVDANVERLRWAVAYSTRRGCERLSNRVAERMGEIQWANSEKHFITSFDFGITEPSALDFLVRLPNSNVRIANAHVIDSHGLVPRNAYHPKLYLFDAGQRIRFVTGSANLTDSALNSNTEIVVAGNDMPENYEWNDIWDHLILNTHPLTNDLIGAYRQKLDEIGETHFNHDQVVPSPSITVGSIPLFWDSIVSGNTSPSSFSHFWIQAGSMSSGGSHNQLELPRGANRFFGFNHIDYSQGHFVIGYPTLSSKTRTWTDRPLTWHGNNMMERINLPTKSQGGNDYVNTAILFRRRPSAFEIHVFPWSDGATIAWRAASEALNAIFRVGSNSDRICGLF